jgi:hypothetical protein
MILFEARKGFRSDGGLRVMIKKTTEQCGVSQRPRRFLTADEWDERRFLM